MRIPGENWTRLSEKSVKKCLDDWIIRWPMCIVWEWAYFKDDKINLHEWLNYFLDKVLSWQSSLWDKFKNWAYVSGKFQGLSAGSIG